MRRNIEIFISGRASSTRPGTGPSVSVSQKTTTSPYEEKKPKIHCEESHHNLRPALHVPTEKDSSASAKPLDTIACVQQSAKSSGDFQASKLQIDNIKPLACHEVDSKPQSVTGKQSKSSVLGNLYCHSQSEASNLQGSKQESFDPFAEGVELTLPSKYRKLKAASVKLFSELKNITEKSEKPSSWQHFVDRLEAGFDMGDISTHKELQDKAKGLLDEHEKLSRLTRGVVNRSHNLSEDSSWQEVYKCYRLWQIVLSKFNELQRRTQQLLEGEKLQCLPVLRINFATCNSFPQKMHQS